jgi:hypothetical protein
MVYEGVALAAFWVRESRASVEDDSKCQNDDSHHGGQSKADCRAVSITQM